MNYEYPNCHKRAGPSYVHILLINFLLLKLLLLTQYYNYTLLLQKYMSE